MPLTYWNPDLHASTAPPQRYRRGVTSEANYLVGAGIADVTGEAGGAGMMGYAMPHQRTGGIHLRQWARAFVIADAADPDRRIVFLTSDVGMIFTSVHQEVLRRLADRFGDRYTAANTILTASHTHSGPGGFSNYNLYNVSTFGFRPRTFEAIVSGFVLAIERADADAAPGTITVNKGDLFGASVNRSLMAFERNPLAERDGFPMAIDPEMTVLKFERNGSPIGVLSWFATHGTSIINTNKLISSDNKGIASYLWEHDWAGRSSLDKAEGTPGFIAAFAQGNAGDMSPNVGAGHGHGPAADNYFANARVVGTRQAVRARDLFNEATEQLTGPIEARQRFIDFSHIELEGKYLEYGAQRTWPAIIGQAFTSGCVDGLGLPFIKQGSFKRHPMFKGLDVLVARASDEVIAGHAGKPVGLATGSALPNPWTPQVLPLQLVRIGQLAIVTGPGEFTITSGRRIREAVAAGLGEASGVTRVVFSGYANAYSGYVTTPEEYSAQLYEGGSTHFGPGTLPAYQQEYEKIAAAMSAGEPTPSLAESPDLSDSVWIWEPTLKIRDSPMRGRSFGDVLTQPYGLYRPEEIAEAEFCTANPSNDTRNGSTFLKVQRAAGGIDGGEWVTVATDDDWETMFHWRRGINPMTSRARISWRIPPGTEPGTYRFVHYGKARTAGGEIDFEGTSDSFAVSQ